MEKEDIFLKETEAFHNLRTLEEIEKNPNISQRELSRQLGVALGIANALLKTLTRKGFIKIRGDNNRTLTYHLTRAGVLAKSKLALKWTLNTVDFYRQTRLNIENRLCKIAGNGIKTAAIYGGRELLEISLIVAQEVELEVLGVIIEDKHTNERDSSNRKFLLNTPIIEVSDLKDMEIDVFIICRPHREGLIDEVEQLFTSDTIIDYLV
ncbi:MAG: winged helix-turn-helix transcriptional regulator [Rubrobacteridae bacterium]|nr:winged helix-turn-helix transcriptional regulator [Rubrobacteridae bacterium]